MNDSEFSNTYNPSAEEVYSTLLRSLKRRKGFGLVFIQCSPAQANRLIPLIRNDLPGKKIAAVQLVQPVDNLYNLVAGLENRTELDVLFIQGLEKSLESDIQPGYGGEGEYYNLSTVPRVLSHLNQQRENFRDHFSNICFVFTLPLFAIKYFIRRAPDFFDWGSGIFEFSESKELDHYLESRMGASNVTQAQLERERELARLACGIDWDNSTECAAAWDAVEELQAEASHQRIKIDNTHQSSPQNFLNSNPNTLECNLYENLNSTQLLLEGDRLLKSRRYEDAISYYNKAIKIKPDCLEAWNNLGTVLVELGRYQEAVDSYNNALKIKSNTHEAWYNRGIVLFKLKRYEEAIESYEKALELKPNYYESLNNKGILLVELGRYQDAINIFERTLKLKSEYYEAWNNLGIALVELERYQEAIDSYNNALQVKPDTHEAWYNRGLALFKLKRYEEAVDSYDRALKFKSNKYEALYNKGIALRSLGRYEEAVNSYSKAIGIKPDFLEAWYNRGTALRNLERYEEAIASYDTAIRIASDESNLHYDKACCYGLQGNAKGAVEALHQAIVLNPDFQRAAKTDSDFDRIRSDNRFQSLIDEEL